MQRQLLRRLLAGLVTLIFSTILIFVLIRVAPGDPVKMFLGSPADMPLVNTEEYKEKVQQLREELGLDKSMHVQYFNWIGRLLKFDMGTSIYTKQPVGIEIAQRIPATLLLSFSALLVQLLLSLFMGTVSAVKAGQTIDGIIRLICVFLASVPGFVLGLSLLLIFAVHFHFYEISYSAEISRLWLPAITLGIITTPQLSRVIRASLLSEMGQLYVISSMARGLPRKKVLSQALRNALIPVITLTTYTFATLMGGSVIIESIFSWPGIGEYALTSVLRQDYPVIQAYAFITVLIIIVINLIADLLTPLLNPQMNRKGGSTA